MRERTIWWLFWGVGGAFWLAVLFQIVWANNETAIVRAEDDSVVQWIETPQHDPADTASVQVAVPRTDDTLPDPAMHPAQPAPQTPAPKEGCVNVNTAPVDILVSLDGIGPVLAERIVAFRKEQGKFTQASDLIKVKGIGDVKLKKIRDHICF